MKERYIANLERSLRVFVRIVVKLESEADRWRWAAEIAEARACMEEAREISQGVRIDMESGG